MSLSSSDSSLMNFMISQFFAILIGRKYFEPNYSTLCKIAETLISLEEEPDIELKKEVD